MMLPQHEATTAQRTVGMSEGNFIQRQLSGGYHSPERLSEALELLATDERMIPLAGGTDIYPASGTHPLSGTILDLTRVAEMRGISETARGWRIGATTTWADLAQHSLPPAFDALRQAALQVGSVQIQNRATIAGNLCNASPAADGVPPLLVLDAEIELASPRGLRILPLHQFITGYRRTALARDEIVTAIHVPPPGTRSKSLFSKLGARKYLVISIIMVAVLVDVDEDRCIREVRIAIGSASEKAERLPLLENALKGKSADAPLAQLVRTEYFAGLQPISDVRATARYRHAAAQQLVHDGLQQALASAKAS